MPVCFLVHAVLVLRAAEVEAARAYDACARALHGNSAVLNFPSHVIGVNDLEASTAQAIRNTLRGAQALHGKTGVPLSAALRRQFSDALGDDTSSSHEDMAPLAVTLRSAAPLRHDAHVADVGGDAAAAMSPLGHDVAAASHSSSTTGNSGHSARTVRMSAQSMRSDADAASLLMQMSLPSTRTHAADSAVEHEPEERAADL